MPTAKLKILILLIEPPLPFGNAASRWSHVLVNELQARGHKVDVLVASGVDSDIEKAKKVFASWPNMHIFPFERSTGLLSKIKTFLYPQKFSFNSDFMECLQKLNPESYDVIHSEITWAAWPVRKWAHKTLLNVHFLQAIDLEHVRPQTFKDKLLFKSWFLAEKKLLTEFPYIRTCSERLTEHIATWGPKPILETVPFGIDLSLYPFILKEQRQNKEPIVTLIGNMSWYPSLSAAKRLIAELWPAIKEQVPEARLRIVGWNARTALKEFLHLKDVEVLENVPDIRPYFEQASVLVYPPGRGSGMKIKIQEALAFGIPVVTTSEGAEGLPAIDMKHMGLSDNNEELIKKSVALLKDFDLQEQLRREGRQMLENHCNPKSTVDKIERLHQQIYANNLSK